MSSAAPHVPDPSSEAAPPPSQAGPPPSPSALRGADVDGGSSRALVPGPGPRRSVRRAALALGVAGAALLALGLASCTRGPTLGELETKVYGTPLIAFVGWWETQSARAHHTSVGEIRRWWARERSRLDGPLARQGRWDLSTDFCSFSPDTGPSFDFRPACLRHDFAWRNLRRLDRIWGGGIDSHARRQRASRQFGTDLHALCALRSPIVRAACNLVANAYERAVLAVS